MGILTHDFQENSVYQAVCQIGQEFKDIGDHLVNLKKENDVAILISNESLTALNNFPIDMKASFQSTTYYNDILRWVYDALYRLNIECDFITPETQDLARYKMIVIPALYDADETLLTRLDTFTKEGGTILATFKTAYANEDTKVYPDTKPHILHQAFGMTYNEFTFPNQVELISKDGSQGQATLFIELLKPTTAKTLVKYQHPSWGRYSAITCNDYGKGHAYYIGTKCSDKLLETIIKQAYPAIEQNFPIIIRKGTNDYGKQITYYFNYSKDTQITNAPNYKTIELRQSKQIQPSEELQLQPWSVLVLEEQ